MMMFTLRHVYTRDSETALFLKNKRKEKLISRGNHPVENSRNPQINICTGCYSST